MDTETQKPVTVYYDGEVVGEFVTDMMVNDAVIIELKSARRIILNFGERKVEIKGKVEDLNEAINRMKKQSSQSCDPV